jgi:molecular chaperone DnaK (HSP70)
VSDVVVGIDLGTTNSCVAIPESVEVHRKDELVKEGRLLPVRGALVITDSLMATTTPSAVWVDVDGSVVVGALAKQKTKVSGEPRPALFFKRLMGIDQRVVAGHGEMSPEEASSHVLRYLKDLAGEVLGVEVTRAVVTVPAFFAMNAKQATAEAGALAGLEVVDTLLEPVAAALMYTRTTTLERPTTFLVYDLGGGTFDASVVVWTPDVGFEMKAFDGDTSLGGYDFDRAIVNQMIDELGGRYDLDLDLEGSASDAALFYRLLVYAEVAKQDLTRERQTTIVDNLSEDRAGTPMSILFAVTRPQFEEWIDDRIEKTLASAERALERAGVEPGRLDHIIMVGGSSEIPVVAQRLEERFGKTPQKIEPHLCVAVGAALKAATVPRHSEYLRLDRVPERTALESIDVTGEVREGAAVPSTAGATLRLTSDDGQTDMEETSGDGGGFLFEAVPLRPRGANEFTVRLRVDGSDVDSQRFVVEHTTTENAPLDDLDESGYVLPHDVSIETTTGLHLVAPVGTRLPSAQQALLQVADRRGQVRVRVYDGNQPIGEVVVRDLPRDLPIGAPVDVDLVFNRDWTVETTARVKTGATEAVAAANLEIPKIELPSWDELRATHQELTANWSEKMAVGRPIDVARDGPRITELLGEALDLINEGRGEAAQRSQVNDRLLETETLIKAIRPEADEGGLEPSWDEFESLLAKYADRIDTRGSELGEAAQAHRDAIPALRALGKNAYDAGDAGAWANVIENVKRRIDGLEPQGDTGPQPAIAYYLWGKQELTEMARTVRQTHDATQGEYADDVARFTQHIQDLDQQLEGVDLHNEDTARGRLQTICFQHIKPLNARINQWLTDVRGSGTPREGLPAPRTQTTGPSTAQATRSQK